MAGTASLSGNGTSGGGSGGASTAGRPGRSCRTTPPRGPSRPTWRSTSTAPRQHVSNPTGNVNTIYAAFPGHGVYISPNRGQSLDLMAGNSFDPLIRDPSFNPPKPITLANGGPFGGANGGRIVLAKPALIPSTVPNADVENLLYEGWLYAAVADADRPHQRPLPDQGQRRRPGPSSTSPPSRPRPNSTSPCRPTTRPTDLRRARQPLVPQRRVRRHPGRRPEQPQHRLPGRDLGRPGRRA